MFPRPADILKIPQYPNEKGTLFFYWESGFYGILRGIYIDINGKRVGGLNS